MKKVYALVVFLCLVLLCHARGNLPRVGLASFYGRKANHRKTACGERYCRDSFTAACKKIPLGTYLKVTNIANHKMVIVRVNDRGPHRKGRIIDLSYAAARKLDFLNSGVTRVKIDLADSGEIANRTGINADTSHVMDSSKVDTTQGEPTIAPVADNRKYKIQAGIFSLKHSAIKMEAYLNHNNAPSVKINAIHLKGKPCYEVVIGPVNKNDKDMSLSALAKKHIKGLVTVVKTGKNKRHKHRHKK